MNRIVGWLRSLRLWFVDQRSLRGQVLDLQCRLDVARIEHEKAMKALTDRYDQEKDRYDRETAASRVECQRWEEELAESERRRLAEVRNGNAAWQEAGIQRRRADGLQVERDALRAELDRLAGSGVSHATARD